MKAGLRSHLRLLLGVAVWVSNNFDKARGDAICGKCNNNATFSFFSFFIYEFCHLHSVSDVICFIRLISCLVLWSVYKFCGDRWGLYQIPSNLVVFEWVGFVPWKILKPMAYTNVNVFYFIFFSKC